ncbi:MAG: ribbon-helix-helix protein, CopG family [Lachnospiraceae bacterium]
MSPRTGRPKIDNPKSVCFSIRLDDDIAERLDEYCKKHQTDKAKAIRKGIELLLEAE